MHRISPHRGYVWKCPMHISCSKEISTVHSLSILQHLLETLYKIRCWKQRDEQSRGRAFKELIVCQIKRVYTDNAIEFDKSYDRDKFRMCGISQKGHLTMLPNGYETWGRSWRMNKNSLKRVDEEGRGKSIWKDMKQRTWKIFRKVESAKHGVERWAVSLS